MDDLISRQWLMECVNEGWIKFDTEKDENRFIHLVRDMAPSAEEEPCEDAVGREAVSEWLKQYGQIEPERKKGKWEEKAVSDEKVIDEWQSARCSAYGKYHTAPYMYYFDNYNFCPNCGSYNGEEYEK